MVDRCIDMEGIGDPTFAPATIAPAMISQTTKSYIEGNVGFLVRGRVRVKIRIRVRVRVTFNVKAYHWSTCRRNKCCTFRELCQVFMIDGRLNTTSQSPCPIQLN